MSTRRAGSTPVGRINETLDASAELTGRSTGVFSFAAPALFVLVLLASIVPRVALSTIGHNWDMESWEVAADLFRGGQNVYANTYRYNYGPTWFLILSGLRELQIRTAATLGVAGPEAFHIYVASFLAVVDAIIALLLWRRAGAMAALFFAFCPVSVLVTGFHSQFDNFAILIALIAWMILFPARGESSWTRAILAGAVLGASLATKHLMMFFPAWILFTQSKTLSKPKAIVVALLAYAIFAGSFIPFATTAAARHGIASHVFGYRSQVSDLSFFVRVIDLAVPWTLVERPTGLAALPVAGGLTALFILTMLLVGRIVALTRPREMFFYYLIALVLFSIGWAEQYLVIPLVACAVYRQHLASWIYVVVATGALVMSPHYAVVVLGGQETLANIFSHRRVQCYHAVFWLLPLLLKDWLPTIWRAAAVPGFGTFGRFLWQGRTRAQVGELRDS